MGLYGRVRIIGRREHNAPMTPTERAAYRVWQVMIYKCFDKSIPIEVRRENNVSSRFKDFKSFQAWFEVQACCELDQVYLNKDLLYKHNRVYSDATCVLLPKPVHDLLKECRVTKSDLEQLSHELEGSITGNRENAVEAAYEAAKAEMEASLRIVAEKYKDVLDPRAYKALIEYKIEVEP